MRILMMLLQLFSGTAAGFITNKFAVKWLFKPVTVFGHKIVDWSLLGTEEKQEKFIDSLAECVEKNVLTQEVLKTEICNPKMRAHIQEIIGDIFENSLKSAVNERRISELQGFYEFKHDIFAELNTITDEILPEISGLLLENVKISDIVSEKQLSALITELTDRMDISSFENTDKVIIDFINSAADSMNLTALVKRLLECLDIRSAEPDNQAILRIVRNYVNTSEFEHIVIKNTDRLFDLLGTVDRTIYDILSPAFREKLDAAVRALVPAAIPVIIDFIEKNRQELEELIDDAVRKTHGIGAGMIQGILKMLNIPQRLIDMINSLRNEDSEVIADAVVRYLKTTTLGEFSGKLRKYLTGARVYRIIVELINKYGERGIRHAVEWVKNNAEPMLTAFVEKHEHEIKAKLKKTALEKLNVQALIMLVRTHPKNAAELIYQRIERLALNEKVIRNGLNGLFSYIFEYYQDRHITALVRLVNRDKHLRQRLAEKAYGYLENNLKDMLEGNVKRTVKATLGRLDTDQLLDVAMKLMSGELKYLSYFGGLLGFVISAFILPFTMRFTNMYGFAATLPAAGINLAAMAFIGIFTNIIAIGMFFRPYKPIKFLTKNKHTRLISQGLILQNQARFAEVMGNYINDELITPDSINRIFENNKKTLSDLIVTSAVPFASKYIEENKRSIAGILKDKAMSALHGAAELLSGMKVRSLKSRLMPERLLDSYSGKSISEVLPNEVLERAINSLVNREITSLKMSDNMLKAAAEQADQWIDRLDADMIKTCADKLIHNYVLTNRENARTIGDMLNDSIKGYINEGLDDLAVYCREFLIKRVSGLIDKLTDSSNPMIAFGLMALGDTLEYLKTVSLPQYIASKTGDIKQLIKDFIENKVYPMDKEILSDMAANIDLDAESLINKYKLHPFLKETAASVIMGLKDVDLLNYINTEDFEQLRAAGLKHIHPQKIAEIILEEVDEGIPDLTPVSEDIRNYIESIQNVSVGELTDSAELKTQLEHIIQKLTVSGFEAAIENAACRIIERECDLHIVNDALREDLLKPAADAIYQSVRRYSSEIVSDIDFYGVTKERINSLNPEEIETLIRSFANQAFHNLYALGAIGLVFGINSYLSIAVAAIDAAMDRRSDKKD